MTDRSSSAAERPELDAPDERIARAEARAADAERRAVLAEQEIALRSDRIRQLADESERVARELAVTRRSLERLEARRSVRVAMTIGDRFRVVSGLARSARAVLAEHLRDATGGRLGRPLPHGTRRLRASRGEALVLARTLRERLVPSAVQSGALVSAVIIDRDGGDGRSRLLAALERTTYRPIETMVVDLRPASAAAPATAGVSHPTPLSFPLQTFLAGADDAPGVAIERALTAVGGETILFLDASVEPLDGHWLGHMVQTLNASPDVVAVGARLILSRTDGPRTGPATAQPDLTLQHRGIDFGRADGLLLPRVLGSGEDPSSDMASATREVPAASGACLLVSHGAFLAAGGWDAGYGRGLADVDLALRLRTAGGQVMVDGRAALWRRPPTPGSAAARESARAGELADRRRFVDRWGPRLAREVLVDRLNASGRWSETPLQVAVVGGDAPSLVDALGRLGWAARVLDQGAPGREGPPVDLLVTLDDAFDIRVLSSGARAVAVVGSDPSAWLARPWLDEFELVLSDGAAVEQISAGSTRLPVPVEAGVVPDALAAVIRREMLDRVERRSIAICVGVPSWEAAERWGDYHFARALQRQLERLGRPTRLRFLPDWDEPVAAASDVVIHLLGLRRLRVRPGQLNVLWNISHPDVVTDELLADFDLAFCASTPFAAKLAERSGRPVMPLHQATDPDRFRPEPGGPPCELLLVANSRGVHRKIVDDLTPTVRDLAVYGSNWRPDLIDPRHLRGDHVANAELNRHYAAAEIVLNDHWDDMRREGFISNRIYDALASGAFVISDDVEGMAAEFDGAVATYREPAELRALIDRYLGDPVARRARAEPGRAAVLARHTFAHRAATIVAAISPLIEARPPGIAEARRPD